MADVALIHYEIPDDLHRQAKSAAALNGQTLKAFLIEAIEQATKANEASRKRKGR